MNQDGQHIVAKSVQEAFNDKKPSNRETWARVCYYYPQYTLESASKLPIRDLRLLLKIAEESKQNAIIIWFKLWLLHTQRKAKVLRT